MRKHLLAAIVGLVVSLEAMAGLIITPGTPVHTHSDGNTGGATLQLSESPTSTKACAAGYTRKGPNYCQKNAPLFSWTALTRDACASIALPSAEVVLLVVNGITAAKSANSVLERSASITAYSDASCTAGNETGNWGLVVRENAAVAAGNQLGSVQVDQTIAVSGSNFYLKCTDDLGNQGTCSYMLRGYYD